jgi:O-glycosyl hydrolase
LQTDNFPLTKRYKEFCMKNSKLWGIPGILLVFGLLFTACSSGGNTGDDGVKDAAIPEITVQPAGGDYDINEVVTPLAVTAAVSDGGVLSYQWYSNILNAAGGGTVIEGADEASYTPSSSAAGRLYYYVVVTNTNNNVTGKKTAALTSSTARVVITDPTIAEAPEITFVTQSGNFYQGDPVLLKIDAEVETGDLSYQWYSNTAASNSGGTAIPGADDPSYELTLDEDGDYYYYVVVTNTDPDLSKTPSTVTSSVITITVAGQNPFASLSANMTVSVDTSNPRQFIRGVGGMSDQCFIYGSGAWTDRVTLADIQNMFGHGPQELGLNMYRLLMYPYLEEGIPYTGPKGALIPGNPNQGIVDDTSLYQPGPSGSKSGTLAQDQSDYYEIIKKVNEMNGYVMLCPWIVPIEFTRNSSSTGYGSGTGNATYIDVSKFNELADWYVSYIQNLVDHGAPIFALSVQNEPDQGVGYDGCRWSGNDQRDMIRILGPKLEAANLKGYGGGRVWDKIWLATGENAGLPGTAGDATVNDTGPGGASQYVEIATRHLYGSMGPYTPGITAIADPTKGLREIWQTEHCDTTNAGRDSFYPQMSGWDWAWHIANETYLTFALNRESAFIWWTSKRFYGYLGEGNFGTTNGAVLPRGHVMAHFGKYVLNTYMVDVNVTGSFVENRGINANSGDTSLGSTTLPVEVGTNLNPSSFTGGNSNTNGQNQPTTKIMAFEADDHSYISIVAFTPTRNSGYGGQDAGNIRINLPPGFTAGSAELMRSSASAKQVIEAVPMNSERTAAIINLPRNQIVSVKFNRAQ